MFRFFLPRNQWSHHALKSLRFFIKISDHEHYKNTGLLKSFPCPACECPGNLIWNGLRYGGPEKSNFNPAVRGYSVGGHEKVPYLGHVGQMQVMGSI